MSVGSEEQNGQREVRKWRVLVRTRCSRLPSYPLLNAPGCTVHIFLLGEQYMHVLKELWPNWGNKSGSHEVKKYAKHFFLIYYFYLFYV